MAARQRCLYPRRNILIINGQTSATSTPSAARTFLQTKEKEEKNGRKTCIFSVFFVSLQIERQNCDEQSEVFERKAVTFLTAAAKLSHVRHKILPRPLQTFRTGGANLFPWASLPVSIRSNPFSIGLSYLPGYCPTREVTLAMRWRASFN